VTVSVDRPELLLCVVSPEYVPVIEIVLAVEGAVYVTLHWLWLVLIEANVQEIILKLPPERLALHDTLPVGAVGVPELVSVTVAVNIVCPPRLDAAGFGDIAVDVALSTFNDDMPELVLCVASPE
jgi:hypothetical protein